MRCAPLLVLALALAVLVPAAASANPRLVTPTAPEVVRGAYAKVEGGPVFWLPPLTTVAGDRGGALAISFGGDVVDRLGFTLALEGRAVHRTTGGGELAPPFSVSGGQVGVRVGPNLGGRRTRRVTLSAQVAGGVGRSAFLRPAGPVGLVRVGAGIEYYTRLSHFSIGLDVGWDLVVGDSLSSSIGVAAFAKYTFGRLVVRGKRGGGA